MKRARYVTGAAMLTPVAMAMAVPAAAQAATTTAPRAPHSKGVSLHPVRVTRVPDVGCTGVSPFHINASPNSRMKGHGWETRHNPGSVCVGTVVASTKFTKNICKSVFASTYELGTIVATETGFLCGTTGQEKSSAFGFHSLFTGAGAVDVSVCVGSEYDGGHLNCVGV
jgi:hypothetical protein